MTNKKTFLKLINLFLVFAFLLTSGFGCQGVSQEAQQKMKPVTLNYWRTNDDEDAFTDIINDYETIHPNIKVVYRKFQPEEYDQELLNAFAEDRGPDLFSIPEPRLKEYQSKLLPMPATVKMAYPVVQGTIKKETVIQVRTNPTLTTRQVKDSYPDIVYKNIYINNALYGLPLSFETLVMFYNKDILNKVGIATPPTTWDEFATDVKKINRVDSGKITQSGAALGGGSNISASFDILSDSMGSMHCTC